MKPLLKDFQLKEALLKVIHELDWLMESGKPKFGERVQDFLTDYVVLFWFMGIGAYIWYSAHRESLKRQQYAQVSSQLDEIDRARAQALQGQYQAETCPICFEEFGKEEGDEQFTKGSDGQPIRLLRCGHVFCECCFDEWVSTGQTQVSKCPICKQDVGDSSASSSTTQNNHGSEDAVVVANNRRTPVVAEGDPIVRDEHGDRQQFGEQRALRRYNYERQFRLARLGRRFPQYIGSQQIQRWTQSTYDGSLARDPTFVRNNPTMRSTGSGSGGRFSNNSSSSGGYSGFGGGSSGGGRGGRW